MKRINAPALRATVATVVAVAALGACGDGAEPARPVDTPPGQPTSVDSDMAQAFEETRAAVEPLLPRNDPDWAEFRLALNQETGDAVLYLPDFDTVDVQHVAAEAVAAAEAAPGSAPVVPAINKDLDLELDAVAMKLFANREEWATDPDQVYDCWTNPEDVSVTFAVEEPAVAANLPDTMQLDSGATATIRIDESEQQ